MACTVARRFGAMDTTPANTRGTQFTMARRRNWWNAQRILTRWAEANEVRADRIRLAQRTNRRAIPRCARNDGCLEYSRYSTTIRRNFFLPTRTSYEADFSTLIFAAGSVTA